MTVFGPTLCLTWSSAAYKDRSSGEFWSQIFCWHTNTGADGISVEEAVDLSDAKARVGDRVCIMGNLDGVGLLLRGTAHDVRNATELCISKAGCGGGFVLSSGDETPRDCPSENIDAIVQVAKTFGRYPHNRVE